jgi:hypothetical protein
MSATKSALWYQLEQQEAEYTPSDDPDLPETPEPTPTFNDLPF